MKNTQEGAAIARKRMNGDEYEALLHLTAATSILQKQRVKLAARVKLIPGGPRDYGLLASRMSTLYGELLKTVPVEQLLTFSRNVPHMVYSVGTKRITHADREKEYGIWIDLAALKAISGVLRDHCMLCAKDTQEQRQCPLAKALDTIPGDKDDTAPGCGYFGRI